MELVKVTIGIAVALFMAYINVKNIRAELK